MCNFLTIRDQKHKQSHHVHTYRVAFAAAPGVSLPAPRVPLRLPSLRPLRRPLLPAPSTPLPNTQETPQALQHSPGSPTDPSRPPPRPPIRLAAIQRRPSRSKRPRSLLRRGFHRFCLRHRGRLEVPRARQACGGGRVRAVSSPTTAATATTAAAAPPTSPSAVEPRHVEGER